MFLTYESIMKISKKDLALCATLVATLTAIPALANEDDPSRFSVGVTAGSLGIGPELGYRLSDTFGVRGNATFLSINHGINSDGIDYDGNVKLKSAGAMLDVYPFGGSFRISGGMRINGNKARATATPTDAVTIGDTVYRPRDVGTLTATTRIKDIAPALTLGYGGGRSKGLVFGIEAGALFQGSVQINPLTVTGLCAAATAPAQCAGFKADIEAERQSINNDIDGFKIYPILQLTLGYRF